MISTCGTLYEELPDFNQESEPDLFPAELQMNRNVGDLQPGPKII